jgi:DNA polymerase III gamma/tau subunit
MLLQMAGDRAAALDVPSWLLDGLKPLTQRFSASEILYSLEVLRETEGLLKGSHQMTIWLEAAAVRLASRDDIPSVKALAERVAELEERIASLSQGGVRPVAREAAPVRPAPAAPRPEPRPEPSSPAPAPPAAAAPVVPAPTVRDAAVASADMRPVAAAAPAAPLTMGGADVLGKVIDAVNRVHRSTGSLLSQHGVFARFESETVSIGIKPTVKMFFEKQDRRAYIEKAIKATFGANARMQLSFDAAAPVAPAAPVAASSPPPLAPLSVAPSVPAPAPAVPAPESSAPAALSVSNDPPMPVAERSVPHAAPAVAPVAPSPEPAPEPSGLPPAVSTPGSGTTAEFDIPDREAPPEEEWPESTSESTEDLGLGVPLSAPVMDRPPARPASDDVIGKTAEIFSGRVIDPLD